MTVTESKPEEVAPDEGVTPAHPALPPAPPRGLAGILGTADHKTVGRLYLGVSLVLLIVFLGMSTLIAAEGIDASTLGPLTENTFFQVWTLSQVGVFFLGLIPALLGLALCVVPLQVGASTIAFPRAAAASFWGWLLGGGVLVGAYLANGGPIGGTDDAVKLFLVAWAMVLGSLALAAVCVIATVITGRTAGMSLMRVPVFSWSMLVSASVWLFHCAALLGNLLLVFVDTANDQVLYGLPEYRWGQLSWILGQPAVLGFAIPLLGVLMDATIVSARVRPARYGVILGAVGAAAALTFGAYAQTAFNPDLVRQPMFVLQSLVLLLPLLAFLGGVADTLKRGRPRPTSAMLVGVAGLLLLLGATAAGALYAIEPLNLSFTVWEAGVTKAAAAATLCAVAAGVFHWGSKIWGHRVAEPLGKLVFLVLLGGGALFAAGDLIAGANGQLAPSVDGTVETIADGAEFGALLSAVGGGLLVLGTLLVVLAVLPAVLRTGPKADADPWGGQTLEWTTSSPPPFGNFRGPIPEVTSSSPLLDMHEAAAKEIS
jgi:heme/copper-type cytochrome/quinol oxidase subunit 1